MPAVCAGGIRGLQTNVFWDDFYHEELVNFAGSGENSEPDTSRFGALSISYGGQALGITLNAVGALSLPKDAPVVDVGSGNGFFPQLLAVAGAPTRAFCAALGPFRRTIYARTQSINPSDNIH